MARCKRCNSFMFTASETGYCKKCSAELLKTLLNKDQGGNPNQPQSESKKKIPVKPEDPEFLKKSGTFLESYYHKRVSSDYIVRAIAHHQMSVNSTWEGEGKKITLLTLAIERGDTNIINALLDYPHCDVNAEKYDTIDQSNGTMRVYDFPLYMAIARNNYELADRLIDCGADINKRTIIGNQKYSMIGLLAGMGGTNQVNYLLRKKTNPDVESYNGYFTCTPLVDAITHQQYEIAESLLNAGANADYMIHYSQVADYTLLSWSVINGDLHAVNLLLKYNANPNCIRFSHEDNSQNPALFDAVWKGEYKIAEALLKAGADPNCYQETESGRITAIMEALHTHNFEIMDLITSYGGK